MLLVLVSAGLVGCESRTTPPSDRVLLVCNGSTKPCPKATYFRTVQAAVTAARPGNWVLIWPGVYHEKNSAEHAGIWITTPDLHVVGLGRASVVIDGSNGTARRPCPSSPARQDFTPRDGIVVWKAGGVTISNLTVCDYLAGPGGRLGIEIWWNGGDGSGKIGLTGYGGSYLTATSMFHPRDVHNQHLAQYGIFAGNASGPGRIADSYASNMAAGAFYVGACQRLCDTILSDDRGTNSALGYLGTNSGGQLVVKNSVFDQNRTGMVLASLNSDDPPSPQDGRCPGSNDRSCTLITHNLITANNNADAPAYGINPAVGVGIEVNGGRFDTITGNEISGQGAWGVLVNDNVDTQSSQPYSQCQEGLLNVPSSGLCLLPAYGNRVVGNRFTGNGSYGNPTNGDLADVSLLPQPPPPRNCFSGNAAIGAVLTSAPARIESTGVDGPPCRNPGTGNDAALLRQIRCDLNSAHCGMPHTRYPRQTKISWTPVPALPSMPDPCGNIPANPFC